MYGKTTGKITFYYDNDKLFNDVSLMSAYMTKNIKTDAGSAMDEFSISDDEKDVFDVCVRQTLPNIYETMMKITHGVDDAFDDNVSVAENAEINGNVKVDGTLGREKGTYVEFSIQDNESYNSNVLSLVDATLLNCLKHGVLAEFYSICVNGELYRIAQDKFTTSLFQLKQRLFQLKKKSVTSQLS